MEIQWNSPERFYNRLLDTEETRYYSFDKSAHIRYICSNGCRIFTLRQAVPGRLDIQVGPELEVSIVYVLQM